jgi:RNA polymerase sigma-70 factor (ECF subfamily)
MSDGTSAEELLNRLERHDAAALGELYDRFAPRVLGLLCQVLPSRGEAEDVLREVFHRLMREAHTLAHDGASVAAWLILTARDSALQRRRQARHRPELPGEPGSSLQASLGSKVPAGWLPRPEAIRLIDERAAIFQKVVSQLPKPQREALDLAIFSGCSETEIAAQLGEPLGRARSGLRAAVTFVRHRRRAILGTWAANI